MFTWICPQCGREVPPAYTECPDCAAKAAQQGVPPGPQPTAQVPAAAPPPPPTQEYPPQYPPQQQPPPYQQTQPPYQPQQPYQPPYQPPQQPYQQPQQPYQPPQQPYPPQQPVYPQQPGYPQQPVYPQQPYPPQPYPPQPSYPTQSYPAPSQPVMGQVNVAPYAPPPEPPAERRGLPTWLLTIGFTLAFGGVVWGIYSLVGGGRSSSPTAAVESPAAKPGAKMNPYQKYIEISGVRFTANAKKKPEVKFVVVNHSPAEIEGLAGNVTIWGRTQKSEEEAAGTFTFTTNLGPWESKDLTAPLNTKKEMVELPDWQNVSTDIQVTAPGS